MCVLVCFFFSPNKSNDVLTDISSVAKILLIIIRLFVHYKHAQLQSDAPGRSVLLTVLTSENAKNKTWSVVQGAPGAQAAMTQR